MGAWRAAAALLVAAMVVAGPAAAAARDAGTVFTLVVRRCIKLKPVEPRLETAWFQHLKPKCIKLVSSFIYAFNFPYLRLYIGEYEAQQHMPDIWSTHIVRAADSKVVYKSEVDLTSGKKVRHHLRPNDASFSRIVPTRDSRPRCNPKWAGYPPGCDRERLRRTDRGVGQ